MSEQQTNQPEVIEVRAGFSNSPEVEGVEPKILVTQSGNQNVETPNVESKESKAQPSAAGSEEGGEGGKGKQEAPKIDPAVQAVIDAAVANVTSTYEKRIETMQHGINTSMGKIRGSVKNVRSLVDQMAPMPERTQYPAGADGDAAFNQHVDLVQPIRESITEQVAGDEKLETETATQVASQALQQNYSNTSAALVAQGVDVNAIHTKIDGVVALRPDLALDAGIVKFAQSSTIGPLILEHLYSDPNAPQVAVLKTLDEGSQKIMLDSIQAQILISRSSGSAAPVPVNGGGQAQPKKQAPVAKPAVPPQGGTGGASNPMSEATTGAQLHRQLRQQRNERRNR